MVAAGHEAAGHEDGPGGAASRFPRLFATAGNFADRTARTWPGNLPMSGAPGDVENWFRAGTVDPGDRLRPVAETHVELTYINAVTTAGSVAETLRVGAADDRMRDH